MSQNIQKMELPSITMKRTEHYNEMTELYNSSYSNLTAVITTVGTIVNMKNNFSAGVEESKVSKMVETLSTNIDILRTELNELHNRAMSTKGEDLDMMDLNMEGIQIGGDYTDWGLRFTTLCSQPLADIINYVEQ